MTAARRLPTAVLVLAGVAVFSAWQLKNGYGVGLFILIPLFVGWAVSWAVGAKSASQGMVWGSVGVVLGSLALLALGMGGGLCLLMALPLVIPFGTVGGWLAYRMMEHTWSGKRMSFVGVPLVCASLGFDAIHYSPLYQVQTEVEIAAPPEQVWRHVVTFAVIPEPAEWFFKTGLAYPMLAHIEGKGPGAIRYCEFSTGPFVEPITTWDQPRLLQFSVTQNPAPLNEWSPYGKILTKHLHGYFVSRRGQFRLMELPNHHTLLQGTTWYQHGLQPAPYWRLWSDAIIHRIHLRVLNHIKRLAES